MIMLAKLKNSVFKNSVVYVGTDALCRGVSFLLLPLISKYLIPEQLGITANFDVLQAILSLLAGQAIVNSLTYFYFKRTKEQIANLVSSLIFLIVCLNVFFAGIIFLFTGIIEAYLKIGLFLQLLTVVLVVSHLVVDINKLIFRLEDKPYKFAFFQLVQTIFYVSIQLFLVVGCEMQALGRILSLVIVNVLMFFVHFVILVKKGYFVFGIDSKSVKELLHFGVPLLPHSLSFWIKGGLDKVLLTTYCGLAVNGQYSMAMAFGSIYTMFEQSFLKAYSPYLQKKLKSPLQSSEQGSIVKQTYMFGVCFIALYFIVVGLCWIAVNYVVDEKYLSCFEFVPWILAANTIHIFYSLTIEFIYTAKKTVGLGIITFTGSVIQLGLTFLFINLFEKDGIKYSLVLGSLVIMSSVWWYSNKVFPMPWLGRIR